MEPRPNPSVSHDATVAPLTLYDDGLWPLCWREMAHYRRKTAGGAARFVGITDPEFDAGSEGLDPRRVRRFVHVKVGDEVRVGLDAFAALWEAIPAYRRLGRVARLPVIHGFLALVYRAFAVVRPWLPRKRRACETGACGR